MNRRTIVVLVCLSAAIPDVRAQEFRALITGQVTDPSGAAISGATITAFKTDAQQLYSDFLQFRMEAANGANHPTSAGRT